MGALETIREALETKISAVTGIGDISYENVPYNPTEATPYVRVTHLGGDGAPASAGNTAPKKYQGIVQLDLFRPRDEGQGGGLALADVIMSEINTGTSLSQDGETIRILKVVKDTGSKDGQWYIIPVLIHWFAYI